MKSLVLRNIVVIIVLSILFPVAIQAQFVLEKPPLIPSNVPRDSRADLNRRRDALLSQFYDLDKRIVGHNYRCGGVTRKKDPFFEECRSNFIQIRSDLTSYSTKVKAFGIAVKMAIKESVKKNILTDLEETTSDPAVDQLESLKIHGLEAVKLSKRRLSLLEAIKDKKRGPVIKAMVYRTLALTAASQGDHDEAVDFLKKALTGVPDNKGLQNALRYVLNARDKNKGEVIPNPKVDVLLEALGPGKTWDESISYLEDKLFREQDAEKKQAIRDAIADAKKAAATDNRRKEHMRKVDEFLSKENQDATLSDDEISDIMYDILTESPEQEFQEVKRDIFGLRDQDAMFSEQEFQDIMYDIMELPK